MLFPKTAYRLRAPRRLADDMVQRVGSVAELVQLTPMLARTAVGSSVNVLQRVAMRRSAVMAPAIFFLDEPLFNVTLLFLPRCATS